MFASAASQNPPPAQPITSVNFWDDPSSELNDQRIRKNIPKIPEIATDYQVVRGGGIETLAYLALQLVRTTDKRVIMRALASAVGVLFKESTNFTGAKNKSVVLTGLEILQQDGIAPDTPIATNFEDEETVTVGEVLDLMSADPDELGAYFGILFLAGNKRVDNDNRSAFNEKRKQSATASIIGDPVIFVPDSEMLADDILSNIYAAFLSQSPVRANLTSLVVARLERPWTGAALSFVNMFLLLVENGMSALKIIKEAVLKHPWIRTEFPELRPELHAANEAQNLLKQAPGRERSFLKAIHGSSFVPVSYSEIDNLLGVCRECLKRTVPSYQNYNGGRITSNQLTQINKHFGTGEVLVNTAAAE